MAAETISNPNGTEQYRCLSVEEARREMNRFITIVPDNVSLDKMSEARGMNVMPRIPGMPAWAAVLVHPDLQFNTVAIKHQPGPGIEHPTDFAYGVEARVKLSDGREAKLYVNAAEAGGTTSYPPHVHEEGEDKLGIHEHYWFFGKGYIGEGGERRSLNRYEVIPPFTEHFIQSATVEEGGEGLFSIILIENIDNVPDDKIHKYKTPPKS